jgi:hypothetical protein
MKKIDASQEVYQELLKVMMKRGGPYAGADIPEFFEMVEILFSPEEGRINNAMSEGLFAAADLAEKMGRDEQEVTALLEAMADKGLCFAYKLAGGEYHQAAPFMPGILELALIPGIRTVKVEKLPFLINNYKLAWEKIAGFPELTFPQTRVITGRTVDAGSTI